jgi:hypothetical protein
MRALNIGGPAASALMLASGLATLIALGALALAAWRDYTDAFKGTEQLAAQVARLVEEHTQHYVRAPEQALRRLDERFAGLSIAALQSEPVRQMAESVAQELPQVGSFFIADAGGNVLMMSRFKDFAPLNVADRQYFQAHMQQGGWTPSSGR